MSSAHRGRRRPQTRLVPDGHAAHSNGTWTPSPHVPPPPAQANTARLTHGAATGKGEGKVEERGPAPRAPSGVTAAQTTTAPATPCTSHSRQTVRDRGCHRHVWHERRAAA